MTIKKARVNVLDARFAIWNGNNLDEIRELFPECVIGYDSEFPDLLAVVFPNGEGSFSFAEGKVVVRYDGGGAQVFDEYQFLNHFVVLDN